MAFRWPNESRKPCAASTASMCPWARWTLRCIVTTSPKSRPHAVLQSSDISFGVDNMDLVLVDDVLYTGRTIRAAMNGFFDLGRPQRVSLCVLIDRGHREMPIEAQFVGRTVQTSDTEIIEVRLREIDNEERVVLVDRQEP